MIDLLKYKDTKPGDVFIFASQGMKWAKGNHEWPVFAFVRTEGGCRTTNTEQFDQHIDPNMTVLILNVPMPVVDQRWT